MEHSSTGVDCEATAVGAYDMGKVGETPPHTVGPTPKRPLGAGMGGPPPASAAKFWKALTARPRMLFSTGI
eukprot:10450915-Alexandrium_andersonii.AAC.1